MDSSPSLEVLFGSFKRCALRRYSLTAGRGEKQRKNTFSCFDFPWGIFFLGGELFPEGENRPFPIAFFLSFDRRSQLPPQYTLHIGEVKRGPFLPTFISRSALTPALRFFEAGELGLGRGDD